MIKKQSENNVNATLDRLQDILNDKGIKVIARVDHAAAAKKVDMMLRPTQVIFFGNPVLGTPLMQANQAAGLDLPMRVLAWEDEDGLTWLGYNDPESVAESYNIDQGVQAVKKLAAAMDSISEYATTS